MSSETLLCCEIIYDTVISVHLASAALGPTGFGDGCVCLFLIQGLVAMMMVLGLSHEFSLGKSELSSFHIRVVSKTA